MLLELTVIKLRGVYIYRTLIILCAFVNMLNKLQKHCNQRF